MFGETDLVEPKDSYVSYEYWEKGKNPVLMQNGSCFYSLRSKVVEQLRVRLNIPELGEFGPKFMSAVYTSQEFKHIFMDPVSQILTPKGCRINCNASATDILCALSLLRELNSPTFISMESLYKELKDPILPYLIAFGSKEVTNNHVAFNPKVKLGYGFFPYVNQLGHLNVDGWTHISVKHSWKYYGSADEFDKYKKKILS